MINAYDQGIIWGSCDDALIARKALGPTATQADWWRVCKRSTWQFWQLSKLSLSEYDAIRPAIHKAVEKIVARAIRRGQQKLRGVKATWATEWRRWANRWLSNEDRSEKSALTSALAIPHQSGTIEKNMTVWSATKSTCMWISAPKLACAWALETTRPMRHSELRLQSHDIRSEIPEWPGEL